MGGHEYPWDMTQSLGLALYRTYAVPSIGELLAQHRRVRAPDAQALCRHRADPGRRRGARLRRPTGRSAIRRMNQMHGAYPISNDDMRYVLSHLRRDPDALDGPLRMAADARGRARASANYYRELGRHMNIARHPAQHQPSSPPAWTPTSARTSPSRPADARSQTRRSPCRRIPSTPARRLARRASSHCSTRRCARRSAIPTRPGDPCAHRGRPARPGVVERPCRRGAGPAMSANARVRHLSRRLPRRPTRDLPGEPTPPSPITARTPSANRDTSSSVVAKLVIQRTTLCSSSQPQKNDHSCSGAIAACGSRAKTLLAWGARSSSTAGRSLTAAARRVAMSLAWRALPQPELAGQERVELGGDEAQLGRELSGLLAGKACSGRQFGAQEDHRVAVEESALGAAEGEHVDAGGSASWQGPAEAGRGVGQARAVEEQQQSVRMCAVGQFGDLVDRVDGPELGDLADRHDRRLDVVLAARAAQQRADELRASACRPRWERR